MLKLDKRDIQMLSILQREGRISKKALAERVNLSPTPCWERLKRLEQAGIIESYGAKVSPKIIGTFTTVFMEAELDSHHAHDFDRFERAIQSKEEIIDCWAVGGGIDYLIKIVTTNIDEYQRFVDTILNEDIGLKRYYTYVVTKHVKSSPFPPLLTCLPE